MQELYKDILEELAAIIIEKLRVDPADLIELASYRALQNIQAIVRDDSLDDAQCFYKIEKIICTLEDLGSDGGAATILDKAAYPANRVMGSPATGSCTAKISPAGEAAGSSGRRAVVIYRVLKSAPPKTQLEVQWAGTSTLPSFSPVWGS